MPGWDPLPEEQYDLHDNYDLGEFDIYFPLGWERHVGIISRWRDQQLWSGGGCLLALQFLMLVDRAICKKKSDVMDKEVPISNIPTVQQVFWR